MVFANTLGQMKGIILFVSVLMLTLTGIPLQTAVAAKQGRYGGTLVWGTHTKPTIINPIFTTVSISASLIPLIFNALVRINTRGEIEPDLAESWEISPDGRVYTFRLRRGVKFHDGVELTVDDVKFTYDTISDPKTGSPFKSHFDQVNNFEAVDRYTFRVVLNQLSVPFMYKMTKYIVPKHILEKTDVKSASFNVRPVGTGPFKFLAWTSDDEITLEYNPDYYEGRPFLDKIVAKSFSDVTSLWTALMRGEIDFTGFILREHYDILKNDPAFKAYSFPGDVYYGLEYNLRDPVFSDRKIRLAIAHAINRQYLIDKAARGYGKECHGPFFSDMLGFDAVVEPLEYDTKKAVGLLSEARWVDADNDGILEKDGNELELRVLVDLRDEGYQEIIKNIRQQLHTVGIKLVVLGYTDESALTQEFLQESRPQAHLKMMLACIDPDQIVANWFSKDSERDSGRLWRYQNPELDSLVEQGERSQDKKQRKEIYLRLSRLICDEQLVCFLYYPFLFHAVLSQFGNTDSLFTPSMPVYTIKNWYLSERR